MREASAVLIAVSKELAKQAQDSLPELLDGEQIQREWLKNGVYSRETLFNGETFLSQYDFRQRMCRRVAVAKRGERHERQSLT